MTEEVAPVPMPEPAAVEPATSAAAAEPAAVAEVEAAGSTLCRFFVSACPFRLLRFNTLMCLSLSLLLLFLLLLLFISIFSFFLSQLISSCLVLSSLV